jgi:DNA-binding MarR family transcriptional regulator
LFKGVYSTAVPDLVARELKQATPFASLEQEVLLALRIAASRVLDPWARFLKASADLTPAQYNVMRILRGSHPTRLTSSDVGERMIARDPDVTRLVDRLVIRGLVTRVRSRRDRRVVEVGVTEQGLALLRELDVHVAKMPKAMLGHLGPKRLRQLADLLDAAIGGMGTYP